jgi:hypothetical protein
MPKVFFLSAGSGGTMLESESSLGSSMMANLWQSLAADFLEEKDIGKGISKMRDKVGEPCIEDLL